jgi:two-component system, cell cycle sensor histidine kinase and response regulator CckA
MTHSSENTGLAPAMPTGNETILVVEDEPSLRAMVRTVLARLGYRVLEAESGIDALKIWQEQGDTVDLLFTDMVMPDGLSGQQLAEELRKRRPGLRVLFTSGYSPQMLERNGRLPSGADCLQKPYMPPQLAVAVRDVLAKPTYHAAA